LRKTKDRSINEEEKTRATNLPLKIKVDQTNLDLLSFMVAARVLEPQPPHQKVIPSCIPSEVVDRHQAIMSVLLLLAVLATLAATMTSSSGKKSPVHQFPTSPVRSDSCLGSVVAATDCPTISSCDDCVKSLDCGFCESTGQCLSGSSSGPEGNETAVCLIGWKYATCTRERNSY